MIKTYSKPLAETLINTKHQNMAVVGGFSTLLDGKIRDTVNNAESSPEQWAQSWHTAAAVLCVLRRMKGWVTQCSAHSSTQM